MIPSPAALRRTLCVLAALSALAVHRADAGSPAETETTAPRIVPVGEFKLSDYAGRVVLLDFWASWCKPCRKSIPWLTAMQERHGSRGLTVVAVNLDKDIAAAGELLRELDEAIVVVADPEGKLAEQFQLQGMPSSFHFGRDGRSAGSHVGFLPEEAPAREAEIMTLLESGAK